MNGLVLSLFPGIGLLDRAFEEEGFCIVRGPDLLWGGDIKRFHPPAGRFEGVIGGPPCQRFSRLVNIVRAQGYQVAENLIPEFERCVAEAAPEWFLMENVKDAPLPEVLGYHVRAELVRDVWVGGKTSRLRRFSLGTHEGKTLNIETLALHRPDPEPAVTGGGRDVPIAIGKSGKRKRRGRGGPLPKDGTIRPTAESLVAQGFPADMFDEAPFTKAALSQMIGNGVPLPMGRAVARAVKAALVEGAATGLREAG